MPSWWTEGRRDIALELRPTDADPVTAMDPILPYLEPRAAEALRQEIDRAEGKADYDQGLRAIAKLSAPLDRFFVEVLVMDENHELRNNRIALLQSIQRMISRMARLTEVVVDKSEHRDRGESETSN